ncbi:MAG: Fic family protein [Caldilineaceae bacterium SB0661_bin_32]|uniref:Fic family protein n=1 Tax=Caldilineaceae bacterium SB0661_bin_32 TaxID=2605255 RepID=A0A6B1D1J6_9CHLR|nr:Fic family protein [Caldilineaceae bacterium SB0661_bin_32]
MTPVRYNSGQFPPQNLDLQRLLPLIGPAHAEVARYEGMLKGLPNANVLLSPLASQEAVLSSRIEGTQTTLTELLTFEAEGKLSDESTPEKADIREVLNYRQALYAAIDMLKDIPLSQRLVRDAHEVLMQGVRGYNKAPGKYRRLPGTCWIGPPGSTIETARYVPCPVEELNSAMDALESYMHEVAPDTLVQLAIVHAEFEAIHPFLDGNGRMGRLLVPLFMFTKELLSSPSFYISEYLESHRNEYYDGLLAVSRDNDWTGWCAFFLTALTEQARENQQKIENLLKLYSELRDQVVEETPSQYSSRALDWVFGKPIFRQIDFVNDSGIPSHTARRLLNLFKSRGILKELVKGGGRRSAVLAFPELLNIAEGRKVY